MIPKHSKEELNEVAEAARTGDYEASAKLAEMMRPYVVSFFRRDKGYRFPNYNREQRDEMTQQAWVGVWTALEKFDSSKGVKFSTYALYWVRHEVMEYIAKNSGGTALPRRAWDYARKIEEGYREKHGEDADIYMASDEELASIEVTVTRYGEEVTRGIPYAGRLVRGRIEAAEWDPNNDRTAHSAEEAYMEENENDDDRALRVADLIVSALQEVPDDEERGWLAESLVSEEGWPAEVAQMLLERSSL